MDSDQYEELCRHFIAEQAGLRMEDVNSVIIPNPMRPGLPEYRHQIDLYWETGDAIAAYLNIADERSKEISFPAVQSVQIRWGWALLVSGALLLIASAVYDWLMGN